MTDAFGLVALVFATALLYSSVGHAGASGYLAAMAFYGVAPDAMRPAALVLNILAAALTTARFRSAGHFDRRLLLPLVAGSVPAACAGGFLTVPGGVYRPLLAITLTAAAVRLALPLPDSPKQDRRMPAWVGMVVGAVIGFVSGVTGVGRGRDRAGVHARQPPLRLGHPPATARRSPRR